MTIVAECARDNIMCVLVSRAFDKYVDYWILLKSVLRDRSTHCISTHTANCIIVSLIHGVVGTTEMAMAWPHTRLFHNATLQIDHAVISFAIQQLSFILLNLLSFFLQSLEMKTTRDKI